jgi:uncharacterized protein YbjT (DUF2867 family)
MRILVTGASGFVGGHLARRLDRDGHEVLAMTRQPDRYDGAGRAVPGDVAEPGSIRAVLDGVDVAYYLVHSLERVDFAARDAEGAVAFADAARAGGVARIVYLGALGNDDGALSEHLASRRQVEDILAERASTIALRAGIVVGQGGISWEILCQLVERLPVMVTPQWVHTRTQPIGLDDAVTFLAAAATLPSGTERHFDIGAPEPSTYLAMMRTVADLMARRRMIVPVPVLTPRLSSGWLRLVTDVDFATARALVDSMTTEVVVQDRDIETCTGHRAMTFEEAARRALAARVHRLGANGRGAHGQPVEVRGHGR